MSKVKIASAIAGGLVVFSMATTSIAGYMAAKNLIGQGYSIEQLENQFWKEYRRANSFERAIALTMRPGIRLAYMTE